MTNKYGIEQIVGIRQGQRLSNANNITDFASITNAPEI